MGFIAFSGLILSACSGSKKTTQTAPSRTPGVAAPGGAPNGAPARPGAARGGIKKILDVITKEAKTDEGLFSVHKVGDKYYFEIPDELLEREILIVTRVSGSTENFSFGGAGQKARGQQVIRWQRNGDNILLRHVSYNSVASEEDPVLFP